MMNRPRVRTWPLPLAARLAGRTCASSGLERTDQTVLGREQRRGGAAGDPQLGVDVLDVVWNSTTRLGPVTGDVATHFARCMPTWFEPTRRSRKVIICGVLMSNISKLSDLKPRSSPNQLACSAASAWQ